MATNTQLKFYKVNGMPTSGLVVGAIYFDKNTGMINVATSTSAYEKFGGRISETEWDAEKSLLSITKNDGSKLTLNFSDMASASAIEAKLQTINTNVTNAQNAADAAQADADALEKALGDGFSEASTVAAQLAAVKATADAAAVEDEVNAALELKADKATVAEDIKTAKETAISAAAADATTKANAAEAAAIAEATRLDGLTNGRIDTLDAAYKAADEEILGQIEDIVAASVSVKNADGDKYVTVTKAEDSNEYTVSSKGIDAAIKVETDRAVAEEAKLQGAIDAEKDRIDILVGSVEGDDAKSAREIVQDEVAKQLTSENISDSFDTLKEMAEWLSSHPDNVQAMNSAIEKNASDIADEIAARDAADKEHASAIDALEKADAAQDELIDKKADKTALDATDAKVAANTAAIESNDGDITALQGRATGVEGRLDTIENTTIPGLQAAINGKVAQTDFDTLAGRVDTAEADINGIQEDVANLQTGTGLTDGVSKPVYTGANYIASSATMVAADMALDAKIKEVADSVTNKNVSASGDDYVVASASANHVSVSANTKTLDEVASGTNVKGLAKAEDVYEALCWVEFN